METVWEMIKNLVSEETVILDSACGYGGFLQIPADCRKIGNDIDKYATKIAEKTEQEIYHHNALFEVSRQKFNIGENEKLIIVGNPPYNDVTSIIRSGVKQQAFAIDADIKTRDLGMSFLLSFAKLKADYICVLHPLSYLIKPANFALLGRFCREYRLINNLVISSAVFNTNKMQFPIVIALYKRNASGMGFNCVANTSFATEQGKKFKIKDFSFISDFIKKYPTKNYTPQTGDIFFHTMRDLNALKRNKSFVLEYNSNTVAVDKNKLDYYAYVDAVKEFSSCFPYYFGNFDVLINPKLFAEYRQDFIKYAAYKYSFIKEHYQIKEISRDEQASAKLRIKDYFKKLLGEHYVAN